MAVRIGLLAIAELGTQDREQALLVVVQAQQRVTIPYGGTLSLQGAVKNGSKHPVSSVMLRTSADALTSWTVKVDPRTIELLGPGEQKSFRLEVLPPRTIFGEQVYVQVQVSAAGTWGYSDGFFAVLNPLKLWAAVGGILAVVVGGCFVLVYRRIGRN